MSCVVLEKYSRNFGEELPLAVSVEAPEEFVRLCARCGEFGSHAGIAPSQPHHSAFDPHGFARQQQHADDKEKNALQKWQKQSGQAQQNEQPASGQREPTLPARALGSF